MKKWCIFLVVLVFSAGSLMFMTGCSDSDNKKPSMLESLGVDTNLGSRLDPAGNEVSDDYNPTLKPITQLAKRSEVFVAGTQGQRDNAALWIPSGKYHAVLDWADDATDFSAANIPGTDSWLNLKKGMSSGDVDGDGIDEICVAYLRNYTGTGADKELALRVIKKVEDEYTIIAEVAIAQYADSSITEYPNDSWWMNNFSVACGDVDANGQKETLIAFNGSIFLMGDSDKEYGLLVQPITFNSYTNAADYYKLLKLSAGDVDNNGTDEFVVAESRILKSNTVYGTAVYHIFSGVTLTELESGTITTTMGADTQTLHSSNCAVGDLDADGLNEILFLGLPQNSGVYYMMVLDQSWNDDSDEFEFSFLPIHEHFNSRNSADLTPICAIANFDGEVNGKKQILAYRYLYENLSTTGGSFTSRKSSGTTPLDLYDPTNTDALGSAWDYSLAVGDFDGDTKDDIAFISDGFNELVCSGFNDSGNWVRKGTGDIIDSGAYYPQVTMGDYDGDSISIEFVNSELLFTDPHPIAVLASNPFWKGIDMSGETSFGTTSGSEVEEETSMGFSVGVSVGYESEGIFGLWKASVKTTFESSFDWTASSSISIEEAYTYTTEDEDKVIFTAIPYDVYYYRVIQGPDSDMIGKFITVNLPRTPVTLPVERNYYNAHNGGCPDIDSSILTHEIGNPLSYPTSAEADTLIAAGGGQGIKSTDTMDVGQGSGGESIEMSVTSANGSGFSFDFTVTIESEVGAGGFTAGVSAGFSYGHSYTITTSSGMVYGGSVANIPSEDWSLDKSFSWGLFSYKAGTEDEKFIVVQYYMD